MKKKLLNSLRMLLVAAGLCVGTSAWADTTVGATDNSTGYLGAKSEAYDISENGTWTFNFTNYNSGSGESYQNWLLECNNGSKDLFVLRADRFENVAWANNNTTWSDATAWTDFVTKMNGASITMTVTRNGQHILVSASTTPSTGDAYTYTYNYYNASGDMSLYLSVEAAHIVISSASWSADETKALSIVYQDYESYTANADIKSDLETAGWVFKTANNCAVTATAKQETLNTSPSVTNKYAQIYYSGSQARRWQRWDFAGTSALTADNWTLSFNAALYITNYDAIQLVVAGTSTTGVTSNYDSATNPFFMVTESEKNSTTYSANIGGSAVGESFTLASGTWYRYTIKVTDINTEANTASVSVSIDQMDGTNVFSGSRSNISTSSIGTLRGIAWTGIRRTGTLNLDNVILTKNVSTAVCAEPTYQLTGASGTSRKFTLACETAGSTIYYASSSLAKGADGWTAYASEVTTSEGTIYTYAEKGSATSDIINFSTGAGEAVKLVTPTISRSSDNSVTITADQSSLGFDVTPSPTIYYIYGGEATEYTGAIPVSSDATLSAYAVLDGYTTSETASRAVAPFPFDRAQVENATYSNSFTSKAFSEESITGSEGRTYAPYLLTTDEVTTQWGSKVYFNYTLNGETKESGWNTGVRNGTSNIWYVNGSAQWILVAGLKTGDIIQINCDKKADTSINATYSEKYTYGSYHAYVVDDDGDVEFSMSRISSQTNNYFRGIYVYSNHFVSATVGANGYTTFASPYALDLTDANRPDGLKAYKATLAGTTLTFTALNQTVPAGTGLLLLGETKDGTYNIPVVANGDAVTNALVGVTSDTPLQSTVGGTYYFVMKKATTAEDALAFAPLSTSSAVTIPAGKAYVALDTSAGARSLTVAFDDETTGINSVNGEGIKANGFYNLNGQRVENPTKGLYIMNGKKVILK